MSYLLLLSALIPVVYGFMITGDFSQFFYKPSHRQIRTVLSYRWFLIGTSILLWTLGLMAYQQAFPGSIGFPALIGVLAILFSVMGFFMPGYILFRAVKEPVWLSAEEGNQHVSQDEPVIGLEINGDARAFPVDTILRPHLVHDKVGGEDVTMSYCMLCNSAMAFTAEMDGDSLEFMTPMQWENNLMIYDPGTKNLVQQLTREIVSGKHNQQTLPSFPTQIMSWKAWKQLYPETKVHHYPPQQSFDRFVRKMFRTKIHEPNQVEEKPVFPTIRHFDARLSNKAEVLGVSVGDSSKAYSIDHLTQQPVINDLLNNQALLIAYDSASDIADIFDRQLNGQVLTFRSQTDSDGAFHLVDEETGSTWNMNGKAVSGELTGRQLARYVHYNRIYWYSWVNFYPDTALAGSEVVKSVHLQATEG